MSPRARGAALATVAVAAVLLGGCRAAADPAAAPAPGNADPIAGIESTISSVEDGFAADPGNDATTGH